jgi:hypothetical protein
LTCAKPNSSRAIAPIKADTHKMPGRIAQNLDEIIRMAGDFQLSANCTCFINDAQGSLFYRDV